MTHPEIIRYFMTIPEAAQLVVQSAVLAQGGDVFLLDMGEPVRIKDLAEKMVQLSGLTLRDRNNPTGDIDIVCSGLSLARSFMRSCLSMLKVQPTAHPLIFRAHERCLPPDHLWPHLDALQMAFRQHNDEAALAVLNSLVPEWQPKDSHTKL